MDTIVATVCRLVVEKVVSGELNEMVSIDWKAMYAEQGGTTTVKPVKE